MRKKIRSILMSALSLVLTGSMLMTGIPVQASTSSSSNSITLTGDQLVVTDSNGVKLATGITGVDLTDVTEVILPNKVDIESVSTAVAYGSDIVDALGSRKVKFTADSAGTTILGTLKDCPATEFEFAAPVNIRNATMSGFFENCTNLTKVTGLKNLVSSAWSAVDLTNTFLGCSALTDVTFDFDGVTKPITGSNTFSGCTKLNNLTFNNVIVKSLQTILGNGINKDVTITFSECSTDSGSSQPFNGAFTNVSGTVAFTNYSGDLNLNYAFKDSNQETKDIIVTTTGSSVKAAKYTFNNSKFKSISLSNFVNTNTTDISCMFNNATVKDIIGMSSWSIGACNLEKLFYGTTFNGDESTSTGRKADTIIGEFKTGKNFSTVTDADLMFLYNRAETIDYGQMDLSALNELTAVDSSSKATTIVMPSAFNGNFKITVPIYKTDANNDTDLCKKILTELKPQSGIIAGSSLSANGQYNLKYATLNLTNVTTGNSNAYKVNYGYKISDYVSDKHTYYAETDCKNAYDMNQVIGAGDSAYLYYSTSCITETLPKDFEVEITGNVKSMQATVEGQTGTKPIFGDNINLDIDVKDATKPDNLKTTSDVDEFRFSKFYDVDLTLHDGTTDYVVKSLDSNITITMPLPEDYKTGMPIAVYNWHDGVDKDPTLVTSQVSNDKLIITTKEFSPYAVLYGGTETDKTTVSITWDDNSNESNRPENVEFDYVAEFDDGSKIEDTFAIAKNVTHVKQTYDLEVETISSTRTRTKLTITPKDVTGYTITKDNSKENSWTLTYGNIPVDTSKKIITVKWVDKGYESDRPTTQTFRWDAVYGTEKKSGTFMLARNTSKSIYTQEVDLSKFESLGDLTSFIVVPCFEASHNDMDINGYTSSYDNETCTLTLKNNKVKDEVETNPDAQRTFTVIFNDKGYESSRPALARINCYAVFANGTQKMLYYDLIRDTSKYEFEHTVDFSRYIGDSTIADFTVEYDAWDSTSGAGSALIYSSVWSKEDNTLIINHNNAAPLVESTKVPYTVNFVDSGNTDKRPSNISVNVTATYSNKETETKTDSITIISTKDSYKDEVSVPSKKGDATLESVTISPQAISNYTLEKDDVNHVYTYTFQTGASVGTTYFRVKFTGSDANTSVYPTKVEVPVTVSYSDGTEEEKTVVINVTNGSGMSSLTYDLLKENNAKFEQFTWEWPDIDKFERVGGGPSATYKYTGTSSGTGTGTSTDSTKADFTIKFDDDNNSAGRRPENLTVTLADTSAESNTTSVTIKIDNPTTTTNASYTGTATIPASKTYKITGVSTLPSGYNATYDGLTATLKYTPETIEKTYKVEWEGDGDNGDSTRPSSVTITLKSGDSSSTTATASESSNWSVTVKLPKYLKGVEAAYTPSGASISNYSCSVDGDTLTYKFTGTLTKTTAAKEESIKNGTNGTKSADGESEEPEEELYNFEKFDWIDYANRYSDLKKAYGYNKELLYAHYIRYGLAEGRIATFFGKYENVNEDILKAYFPEDYNYKANVSTVDEELDIDGDGSEVQGEGGTTSTVSGNSSDVDKTTITKNEDGSQTIKVKNDDGTTTETVVDADGNILSTRTYKTGDMRLSNVGGIVLMIVLISMAIMALAICDINKDKKRLGGLLNRIDVMNV